MFILYNNRFYYFESVSLTRVSYSILLLSTNVLSIMLILVFKFVRVRYVHFRANNLTPGINPSLLPIYGLNSKANWALLACCDNELRRRRSSHRHTCCSTSDAPTTQTGHARWRSMCPNCDKVQVNLRESVGREWSI